MQVKKLSDNGDPVLLSICGRVSQRDVEVNEPITEALGDNAFGRQIAIDMSEVESLDSSGVNWLLIAQKKVRESGGKLILHSLSPIARNVIKVLNLHTVLQLAETREEAVQRLQGESP